MKQFFLLGASTVYGVGGTQGGWAELLKQHMHQKMYAPGGEGEVYEVFNFSMSGAPTQFVLDTFPEQLKHYGRDGEIVAVVSVGGNNSKATGTPDNFISTVDEYVTEMTRLIELLKANTSQVILVGTGYVDESKTNPKVNPFDGSNSYFTNARRQEFKEALQQLCVVQNVTFVDIDISQAEWLEKYAYTDGLHPNDAGHQLLFEAIRQELGI